MSSSFEPELELARQAAIAAGQVLERYFKSGDAAVDHKAHGEPVTEADQAAEAMIIEQLQQGFPDYGLLAEERSDKASWIDYDRVWVIDPMDGTRDFIAGREGFCVMIGLLERFRPVLGVIYQPLQRVTYAAARGGPALRYDEEGCTQLVPSAIADPAKARLVASYSHRTRRVDELKQQLGIEDEQNLGSVGLKIALIAQGARDLYLNPDGHCKLWDTCAPEALLSAAGGKMTDLRGQPLIYDDPACLRLSAGIVASNGHCHEAVITKLAPLFPAR